MSFRFFFGSKTESIEDGSRNWPRVFSATRRRAVTCTVTRLPYAVMFVTPPLDPVLNRRPNSFPKSMSVCHRMTQRFISFWSIFLFVSSQVFIAALLISFGGFPTERSWNCYRPFRYNRNFHSESNQAPHRTAPMKRGRHLVFESFARRGRTSQM